MIGSGQTLVLDRARIAGAAATRGLLAYGLARVSLAGLGLGDDELLLIPHHQSRAVLRAAADGGVEASFGRTLGAELADTLASAMVDPLPGARAGAYRFTSRHCFAIWLLGSWLRGGEAWQSPPIRAVLASLPGGTAIGWARRELFDDGRVLPAVFAALARQGLAAALMARLETGDVVRMQTALVRSHALPPLTLVAEQPTGTDVSERRQQVSALPVVAPATPTVARAITATATAAIASGNDLQTLPASVAALLVAMLHLDTDPAVPRVALSAFASAAVAASTSRADLDSASVPMRQASGVQLHDGQAALSFDHPQPNPCVQQHAAPATPSPVIAPVTGFPSPFAGFFFLVNAFLAMGLYPDFTRPADSGLALPPTRLLDQLALGWFGPRYADDRLHAALAPVGADPALPDRWQVPPEWLRAFPEEPMAIAVTRGRYRTVWHEAGFPLTDEASRAAARRRLSNSQATAGFRPPMRLPSAQSARWLACLALYLDARIRRATGDPALGLASLAIPGRCRITADRIDIDLALADLPLPLRMAGLDRDPGWLPVEGRSIAFHFQ